MQHYNGMPFANVEYRWWMGNHPHGYYPMPPPNGPAQYAPPQNEPAQDAPPPQNNGHPYNEMQNGHDHINENDNDAAGGAAVAGGGAAAAPGPTAAQYNELLARYNDLYHRTHEREAEIERLNKKLQTERRLVSNLRGDIAGYENDKYHLNSRIEILEEMIATLKSLIPANARHEVQRYEGGRGGHDGFHGSGCHRGNVPNCHHRGCC